MIITQLSEIVWRFYQDGRAASTAQSFTEADILQMCKLAYSDMMRQLYYASKKLNDGDEYYFYSGILSVKRFKLSDANMKGMRRADMSGVEIYRLPKNSNFTTVYAVGCSDNDGEALTQVQPGEEVFYEGNSEFSLFKFYVPKGQGINTYNLPPCVKALDVETTFDDPKMEVSLDIGYNIAQQILGVTLRIPGFAGKETDNSFSPPHAIQLKNRLAAQQQEPIV